MKKFLTSLSLFVAVVFLVACSAGQSAKKAEAIEHAHDRRHRLSW